MDIETYDSLQRILEYIRENDHINLHTDLQRLTAWADEVAKEYDE